MGVDKNEIPILTVNLKQPEISVSLKRPKGSPFDQMDGIIRLFSKLVPVPEVSNIRYGFEDVD